MHRLVSSLRVFVIVVGLSSWSEIIDAVLCQSLGPPEHGEVVKISESLIGYWCDPGYRMTSGPRYRFCGVDGQWSGGEAVCSWYLEATCKKLAQPADGSIECFSLPPGPPHMSPGSTCHYQCHKGYEIEGDARQMCLPGGNWSGTVACKRACIPLNDVVGGIFSCTNGNKVGSVCRLFCPIEGSLVDYSHDYEDRECLENRVWSKNEHPYSFTECPVGSDRGCPQTCKEFEECLLTSSCQRCPSFANLSIWLRVCGN